MHVTLKNNVFPVSLEVPLGFKLARHQTNLAVKQNTQVRTFWKKRSLVQMITEAYKKLKQLSFSIGNSPASTLVLAGDYLLGTVDMLYVDNLCC